MNLRAFCPHCGANIVEDQPVILDDFSMFGSTWPLCFRGQPIRLTPAEAGFCWALLRSYPNPVKGDVLLNRINSDGYPETAQALICKIRRKLRELGINDPIVTVSRRGYRWKGSIDVPDYRVRGEDIQRPALVVERA